MPNAKKIFELMSKKPTDKEAGLIEKACSFAEKAHEGQKRQN